MKRLIFLLIIVIAYNFYTPFIRAMQIKRTSKMENKYKTELSDEEKKELEKLFKEKKEEECMNFIIENNLDPNIDKGYLIESSIYSGFLNLLKYLIKNGANVNIENDDKDTPLHKAALNGYRDEIAEKKSRKQKITSKTDTYLEIIKTLVENGANIYAKNELSQRPISMCFEKSKIYEYLYSLFPYEEKYTTYYNDAKHANSLDVVILLEDPLREIKEDEDLAITIKTSKCIRAEEAIIASASLIRNLLDIPKNKYPFIDINEISPYSKLIRHIFSKNKFSIFITNDREFVILIPHEKYPEIKEAKDLQKIGLHDKNLYTFMTHEEDVTSYLHSKKKSEELYAELLKQTSLTKKIDSLINIESLINLFLPKKIVDIRAYLVGHGTKFQLHLLSHGVTTLGATFGLQRTLIAQLRENEYRKLRDTLDLAGCSFLYVKSCFSGTSVYKAQTLHRKEIKPEIKKHLGLSSKYFIEIATSLPGSVTAEETSSDFSAFFTNVNNFLEQEKNDVTKIINSDKKLTREDKSYIIKNLTEQQILTGRLELKNQQGVNDLYFINPITVRKKEVKKDPLFVKILKDDLPKLEENLPRARFPGDKEMLPLKEVFPDLIPKIKVKLKNILIGRRDELKTFKESLPYFEKQKNIKQTFISGYKEEIKRSEVEIEDIEKYLKQLE